MYGDYVNLGSIAVMRMYAVPIMITTFGLQCNYIRFILKTVHISLNLFKLKFIEMLTG